MSNSTSHERRCVCVQCTADRINDTSPVLAALRVANRALKRVHDVLAVSAEVAATTYEATNAINERARQSGDIPAVESIVTEELARQEANRADAARWLLTEVGAVLNGRVDLDTHAIQVSYEPLDALDAVDDGTAEGGRHG